MNQMIPLIPPVITGDIVPPPVFSIFKKPLPQDTEVITPEDITMIICLRAHEGNPWVAQRLEMIREFYNPMPRILVVDFGSDEHYSALIGGICQRHNLDYYHEPDVDTYSPAAAHNRGFEQSKTDLVFFCDADCFGGSDMFAKLADIATSMQMKSIIDVPLVLPVYHINEADTASFFNIPTATGRSRFLDALTFYAGMADFNKAENFFTAPYSNIFLINRAMFSMTGGYDERFRGHGSEDFEYLTRLALYIKNLPLPSSVREDTLGPLRKEFFSARPYRGFRRLLEALSKPAENFGLRVFHLFHPRHRDASWGSANDWKRTRMNEAFDGYVGKEHGLLDVDFIAREKTVVCLCKHIDQWGYYAPLRIAGYKLVPVFDDTPESISKVTKGIVSGDFSALAIFNPYMKSHSKFSQLVVLAKDYERDIIVIERGALPGTIYYDDDVAYNSPNFSEEKFEQEQFTDAELSSAKEYIIDIRGGDKTLESMDSYNVTAQRLAGVSALMRPVCFIPLQLEDDMAVTMFLKGEQTYPEFALGLSRVIDENPDILFVVKPHPLSKLDPLTLKPNLVLASRDDNIHFLLDAATFTVCYNSGVGLLSILHRTPTATIGNAFYNMSGAGYRASSLAGAIDAYRLGKLVAPQEKLTQEITAWFIHRRYSSFIATDSISEFVARKAHGYKDILVTRLKWRDIDLRLGRQREHVHFGKRSYVWSQIAPSGPTGHKSTRYTAEHFRDWGISHFKKGSYELAAKDFEAAYKMDPSKPNLLRYAAEAYLKAGMKQEAVKAQKQARIALPKNKNVRLRLAVMDYPVLRFITGRNEMIIPKK